MPVGGMILEVVKKTFDLYQAIMLVRILLSWVPQLRAHPTGYKIAVVVEQATDPVYLPARQLYYMLLEAFGVNPYRMMLDFSPLLAFFAVGVIKGIVISILGLVLG